MLSHHYLNPTIKKDFTALDQKLEPLSLHHFHVLQIWDSPFVTGDKVEIGDLAFAVWVCSKKMAELEEVISALVNDPQFLAKTEKQFLEWGDKYHTNQAGLIRELNTFLEYLEYYLTAPERWPASKDTKALKLPWVLHVFTILCANLNYHPTEVWSMPIGMALLHYAVISEREGAEYKMKEDYEKLPELDKLVAEIQKKKEKEGVPKAQAPHGLQKLIRKAR